MFGLSKPSPVAEYEATDDIERVYHEIRQVLRVRGVNLVFRTWAGYGDFLPLMWDALRPTLETRAFEDAADQIRAEAVDAADALGRLAVSSPLGESQAWQLQRSLAMYHYINPKLLVLVAAVRNALSEESHGATKGSPKGDQIARGVPSDMLPMEMIDDEPDDKRLRTVFKDIQTSLDLPSVNSDYRTLALWPDFLAAAWQKLKPLATSPQHRAAEARLRESARRCAATFTLPKSFTAQQVEEIGEKPEQILKTTETFERILPGLILNIALFNLEWSPPADLRRSPYPAETRRNGAPR